MEVLAPELFDSDVFLADCYLGFHAAISHSTPQVAGRQSGNASENEGFEIELAPPYAFCE